MKKTLLLAATLVLAACAQNSGSSGGGNNNANGNGNNPQNCLPIALNTLPEMPEGFEGFEDGEFGPGNLPGNLPVQPQPGQQPAVPGQQPPQVTQDPAVIPQCVPPVGGGQGLMGRWTSGALQQDGGVTITLLMNFTAQNLELTVVCAGQGQTASPKIVVPIRVTGNKVEITRAAEQSAPFMGGQCQASLPATSATWTVNGNTLTLDAGDGQPLQLSRQ